MTVSDMITPKAQFTQTFFANQAEMIAATWRVAHMVSSSSFLQIEQTFLSVLTINADGAARPIRASSPALLRLR